MRGISRIVRASLALVVAALLLSAIPVALASPPTADALGAPAAPGAVTAPATDSSAPTGEPLSARLADAAGTGAAMAAATGAALASAVADAAAGLAAAAGMLADAGSALLSAIVTLITSLAAAASAAATFLAAQGPAVSAAVGAAVSGALAIGGALASTLANAASTADSAIASALPTIEGAALAASAAVAAAAAALASLAGGGADFARQNPQLVLGGAGVAGGAMGITSLLLYLRRVGWAPLASLYTRISRDKVLDNAVRERVYDMVRASPGIHPSAIKTATGLGWGTIVYHLDRLEHSSLVVSRHGSGQRCYFPTGTGMAPKAQELAAALRHPSSRAVVDFVRAHPDVSQKEIGQSLAMSAALVSWHVRRLVQAEILSQGRGPHGNVLRVRPEAELTLARLGNAPAATPAAAPSGVATSPSSLPRAVAATAVVAPLAP
ncbi:MAG: winged helix-turn-helix transcriptional regulator [Thermoplasmatota archaeon]